KPERGSRALLTLHVSRCFHSSNNEKKLPEPRISQMYACQNCRGRALSANMKNLIGVIILAVVCIILGVTLFTTSNRAKEEKKKDVDTIVSYSNEVVATSARLEEQRQVNVL